MVFKPPHQSSNDVDGVPVMRSADHLESVPSYNYSNPKETSTSLMITFLFLASLLLERPWSLLERKGGPASTEAPLHLFG
jgi:hypothetical protein